MILQSSRQLLWLKSAPPPGACRHWLKASNVLEADRDKLIWCSAATDLPVRPRIRHTNIYIVAEEARIIAHVYDDRGMDIVSSERTALREIYKQFEDWLLPHDIEKMTTTFGAD